MKTEIFCLIFFFGRLAKFLETAASVLNFFEAFLGRIEIKTADKVERVYFEIDEANIEEWEKPQIRESKVRIFDFFKSIPTESRKWYHEE